jgi:virulence factor Mce-like protein
MALVAGVGALWLVMGGAGGGDAGGRRYTVEIDNAFGLIEGADLKIAGVRAGKLTDLRLDRQTNRALVDFEITKNGFGSLRKDVRCEVRPQSLIGEYFVDCLPGTARQELPVGSRIPVAQTASTVPPDLVNNVLRKPYAERLSLIIGELGAAVAGNGKNLNDAVRRAAPALRETDKVLATLAEQNIVLRDLVTNGDQVVGDLAANSKDVGRWVLRARDISTASAERRADIARGFRRLPEFLGRLRPTMAALGEAADAQTPALRNLSASSAQLKQLFDRLGPFADSSRPAVRALGRASTTGTRAATAAAPVVAQLGTFAKQTPELGTNLAMVLEHLDDPAHAVEEDPRAARATGRPAPTGYTGLEALLSYVYDQTMATNVYDSSVHSLKVSVQQNECADYADVKAAKKLADRCAAALGPNQPGINFPDATKPDGAGEARAVRQRTDRTAPRPEDTAPAPVPVAPSSPPAAGTPTTPAPAAPAKPQLDLPPLLPGLPDPKPIPLPDLGAGQKGALLDYLLK